MPVSLCLFVGSLCVWTFCCFQHLRSYRSDSPLYYVSDCFFIVLPYLSTMLSYTLQDTIPHSVIIYKDIAANLLLCFMLMLNAKPDATTTCVLGVLQPEKNC